MCYIYVFIIIIIIFNILVQMSLNWDMTSLWSEFVFVPAYDLAFLLQLCQLVCAKIKSIWLLDLYGFVLRSLVT